MMTPGNRPNFDSRRPGLLTLVSGRKQSGVHDCSAGHRDRLAKIWYRCNYVRSNRSHDTYDSGKPQLEPRPSHSRSACLKARTAASRSLKSVGFQTRLTVPQISSRRTRLPVHCAYARMSQITSHFVGRISEASDFEEVAGVT